MCAEQVQKGGAAQRMDDKERRSCRMGLGGWQGRELGCCLNALKGSSKGKGIAEDLGPHAVRFKFAGA